MTLTGAQGPVDRIRPVDRSRRDDYFRVALHLLAEGGSKAVTIQAVCDALSVTKGAFYYQFESQQDFQQALLLWWEEEYSQRLIVQAMDIPDPRERLLVLSRLASEFEHEAESALRALARTDDFAAEMQRRVDRARMRVVSRTLQDLGFARADAQHFALMSMTILVGAQHLVHPPSPRRIGRLLDAFLEMMVAKLDELGGAAE